MARLRNLAWTSAALIHLASGAAAQNSPTMLPDPTAVPDMIPDNGPQAMPQSVEDLLRQNRFDLSDPILRDELRTRGAFLEWDDPRDVLANRSFVEPPDSVSAGTPIQPDANPLFEDEVWQRLRDLTPWMMPVGVDTSGRTFTPSPGGSSPPVGDPTQLNWSGGLDDISCFRPQEINPFALVGPVNAARLATVLITPEHMLTPSTDGSSFVYGFPVCSADAAAAPPAHCSGILEADGRTLWTAHHCLASPALNLVASDLRQLGIGQSGACAPSTPLRAIGTLGLTTDDHRVPAGLITTCDSIARVSRDVVRVTLTRPLPVTYGDNVTYGTWRFPDAQERAAVMIPDRRLYGVGFLQTPILHDLPGGRLFPVQACARTVAGLLAAYDGKPEPADLTQAADDLIARAGPNAMSVDGFACVSTDTYNGASGGPVFAIDDTGTELVLVGIISGAIAARFDMECPKGSPSTELQEACGAAQAGQLNVMALLDPADLPAP